MRLLPEGQPVESLVDDPEFTEVTNNGEVYTLYRVIRFTHEIVDDPDGWTHLANISRVRIPAIGVAHLLIQDRIIHDCRVTLTTFDA